jgi:hypothetical protein
VIVECHIYAFDILAVFAFALIIHLMPVDFELSDPGSGRDNRCPVQWEDASFMERHSKWLAFENAYDSPMPELSLMDLGLDPSIGGLSDSPEIDAIYKLQPSNIAAQDFKPTPMSFKLETELPWIDLPISPRPSTQSSSVEPVSPRFSPAEEMQGLRKEVCPSCQGLYRKTEIDIKPETSGSEPQSTARISGT